MPELNAGLVRDQFREGALQSRYHSPVCIRSLVARIQVGSSAYAAALHSLSLTQPRRPEPPRVLRRLIRLSHAAVIGLENQVRAAFDVGASPASAQGRSWDVANNRLAKSYGDARLWRPPRAARWPSAPTATAPSSRSSTTASTSTHPSRSNPPLRSSTTTSAAPTITPERTPTC